MLVIADDLSGSLDTGIKFRLRGAHTVVVSARSATATLRRYPEAVIVFNTDSRHLSPAGAAAVVRRLARSIQRHDPHAVIYKKIDSTLRGNIGAELSALQAGWPQRHLVVAPALPAQGRTVQRGELSVRGVPLHQSEFATDPLNPVSSSFVPDILSGLSGRPGLSGTGGFAATVIGPQELDAALDGPPGVWVVDATTEEDLAQIALACERQGRSAGLPLLAGSAGLAHHLSRLVPGGGPRWLIVNGSLNPVALAQTRTALEAGVAGVSVSAAAVAALTCPNCRTGREVRESLVQRVTDLLHAGQNLCLHTVLDRTDLEGWQTGYGERVLPAHEAVPLALGRIIAALELPPTTIVMVIGGDTALGLIDALRARGVVPLQEVDPGVVLGNVELPGGRSMRLISKAGGFGAEDLIPRLMGGMKL